MSRIVPLSALDTLLGVDTNVTTQGFVIDSRLDVDKIRTAASSLAKRWPYLGGWLQRNTETSKIELVVPQPEVAEWEVLVQEREQSIKELQPSYTATSTVSIQRLGTDLSLFLREDRNLSVDEYVKRAAPAFHINVTLLRDATALAFTQPHLLMDAGGFDLVMKAFFSVVRGEEVNPLMLEDPFTPFFESQNPEEDAFSPPGWKLYGQAEFEIYGKYAKLDEEREGPLERRMVYFPKSEIERLKTESLEELRAQGITDVTFFSSGDIILAWIYKHFYGSSSSDLDRQTRAVTLVDTRKRLFDIFPSNKPYPRNAFLIMATPPLTRHQVNDLSLAHIALHIRTMVQGQTSRDFLEKHLRWKFRKTEGFQVAWGPEERIAATSNWLPYGYGDLDFSAISIPGSGPGKVRDVFLYSGLAGLPRGGGNLLFKDSQGGVIGSFHYGSKEWKSGELIKYAFDTGNS
ncbi:hypothetical protein BDZ97DRAFT_1924222 [Flammula alnicola]|nr:hypothetical protein BDZ97DRAFT_1924222 [Flammula alnicola]